MDAVKTSESEMVMKCSLVLGFLWWTWSAIVVERENWGMTETRACTRGMISWMLPLARCQLITLYVSNNQPTNRSGGTDTGFNLCLENQKTPDQFIAFNILSVLFVRDGVFSRVISFHLELQKGACNLNIQAVKDTILFAMWSGKRAHFYYHL